MDLKALESMLITESEWETCILDLPDAVVKAVGKSDDDIVIYAFRLLAPHMWALVFTVEVVDGSPGTIVDYIANAIMMATADWVEPPKKVPAASRSKTS
jgi:hypothetical protein